MIHNSVIDALLARRSIRKFTDEPVTREQVMTVLEAGRWAPSGKNNQPARFLVVMPGDSRQEILAGLTKYSSMVMNAQALIGVFLAKKDMYDKVKDYQSAGACIENMLLAVHALGLGAVWIGQIINQAPQVLEALKLDPEELEFMALLAVGHPAQEGASNRRPLEEFLLETS